MEPALSILCLLAHVGMTFGKHVEYISGMSKDLEPGHMHDACKETHLRLAKIQC